MDDPKPQVQFKNMQGGLHSAEEFAQFQILLAARGTDVGTYFSELVHTEVRLSKNQYTLGRTWLLLGELTKRVSMSRETINAHRKDGRLPPGAWIGKGTPASPIRYDLDICQAYFSAIDGKETNGTKKQNRTSARR